MTTEISSDLGLYLSASVAENRRAIAKMIRFHRRRERSRREIRDNVWQIVSASGVEADSLRLEDKEQMDVFLDAIADAKVVEVTGRTKTETRDPLYSDPPESDPPTRDPLYDDPRIYADPLKRRYISWFIKAEIINPDYTFGILQKVVPALFAWEAKPSVSSVRQV